MSSEIITSLKTRLQFKMRVVSYLNATTVFEIVWEEIRPPKGAPFVLTLDALKARYQFQAAGQSTAAAQQGLMTPALQTGMLQGKNGAIQFNQLDFQPTGIVIGSGTTEQTLQLASDLFEFLHTLGFRKAPENRNRSYSSTVIVDLGSTLGNIFDRWKNIISFVDSISPEGTRFLPFGTRFMAFRGKEAMPERQFIFERRITAPADENWMFSQAPFDTDSHVKILEKIEAEFKA
jgi:hypothetical protein